MIGLQTFPQACGLNGSETMMSIVKQMKVVAVLHSNGFEQLRNMHEVLFGRPDRFGRQTFLSRFVIQVTSADSIRGRQTGNTALGTDRKVTHADVPGDLVEGFL